ncbi:hypothetical protein SNE40_009009 [Patella caerulea]|uniref:Uncharacterized protein n=1 Tax=Patella caerulea TaxID=87958 RepID=A0AAN8JWV1_PATCE
MSSPIFYIVSRLCSYILSIAVVNYWRGVWGFVDLSGITLRSAGLTTAISTSVLVISRGLCNCLAPPLVTISDLVKEDYFKIPTRFKSKPRSSLKFYMDVGFSVVFIRGFAIAQWRGVWTLLDLLLTPGDAFLSAWLSLVAGNILTIFLFVIQWPIMYLARKLRVSHTKVKFIALLAIEDLMTFCGMVAAILVWRGCWQLYDQCLIVDDTELSLWVSHGAAAVLGMAMLHYLVFIQAGLFKDGEVINSGEQTFFDTRFITNFIQHTLDKNKKTSEKRAETQEC